MSYKSIGRQLQLAREQAGWSQEQMAAKIGCSQSTLSNYEKGKRRIYLAQLEKISEALNLPVEFFLRPAEYMSPPWDGRQDTGEPGTAPEPAGTKEPIEALLGEGATEKAMLDAYRSLSAEGQKLTLCFMEWVKKREVAGNA